jgi:hypothetical protein
MPKHVGGLMSTINWLQHPWALVGFFHRIMKNARYNGQDTPIYFIIPNLENGIFEYEVADYERRRGL